MRLIKQLTLSTTTPLLVSEHIVMGINAPAKAKFTIKADVVPYKSQAVALDMSYSYADTLQRVFFGFVENVIDQGGGFYLLSCREWVASMGVMIPIALRHCTIADVLGVVSDKTGLTFTVGQGDYANQQVANFFAVGDGFSTLTAIQSLFKVNDFFWQQNGEGDIFVGSWADSLWANKPLTLEPELFSNHGSHSASLIIVPSLKAGVVVSGQRITSIEIINEQMILSWYSNK